MAEIGLLHHLGWCNADVFAVGTIFCENLFDQCLLFGHRAIHRALKNLLNLFLMYKKKPPPKAGVLKRLLRVCPRFHLKRHFSSPLYFRSQIGIVTVACGRLEACPSAQASTGDALSFFSSTCSGEASADLL